MASPTATLILKALDCLSQRANVTAQNIANAGTPNYRPLRVTFEAALASAAAKGPDALQALQPRIERDPDPTETGLRVDMEIATASTTALRYAALIEVLNRQKQIDALPFAGTR